MSYKPILFSQPMVEAVRQLIKTQTRRVIRKQPVGAWAAPGRTMSPYGIAGDKLWVKETHYRYGKWIKNGKSKLTGRQKWKFKALTKEVKYYDNAPDYKGSNYRNKAWYKRPSIFMPRWASRIDLEITGIKVEHVQDISEADAKAEGVQMETADPPFFYVPGDWPTHITAVETDEGRVSSFKKLWDYINEERGYGWALNPWVWTVEFKKVEKETA